MPAWIVQIDLARQPLPAVRANKGDDTLWMLIRRGATPIGWIRCDAQKFGAHIAPDLLAQLIAEKLGHAAVVPAPVASGHEPFISLVVCHRAGDVAGLAQTL